MEIIFEPQENQLPNFLATKNLSRRRQPPCESIITWIIEQFNITMELNSLIFLVTLPIRLVPTMMYDIAIHSQTQTAIVEVKSSTQLKAHSNYPPPNYTIFLQKYGQKYHYTKWETQLYNKLTQKWTLLFWFGNR